MLAMATCEVLAYSITPLRVASAASRALTSSHRRRAAPRLFGVAPAAAPPRTSPRSHSNPHSPTAALTSHRNASVATRACLEGACKFTETAARLEYKGAKTDEDEDVSFRVFSRAASSVFFEDVVGSLVCSSSWNRASSRDATSGF